MSIEKINWGVCMYVCGHKCDMRTERWDSCCSMFYMDSRQLRIGGGGEPVAASMELNGVRVSGKESCREMKRQRQQRWRERQEERLPPSPPFSLALSREEEDPATQAEEEHPGGCAPRGACGPSQTILPPMRRGSHVGLASLWAQHVQWQD